MLIQDENIFINKITGSRLVWDTQLGNNFSLPLENGSEGRDEKNSLFFCEIYKGIFNLYGTQNSPHTSITMVRGKALRIMTLQPPNERSSPILHSKARWFNYVGLTLVTKVTTLVPRDEKTSTVV